MPLYVHLSKMTRDGTAQIRDLASVYSKWSDFAESLGAKVVCSVATFGDQDFVVVVDYPDEAAALKGAGCAASLGAVSIQTLPACPIEDFFKLMSELPR